MGNIHLEMDKDQDESATGEPLEESGQLEDSLMETVDMGGRLRSGIDDGASDDNVLDFIQMTGLTRDPEQVSRKSEASPAMVDSQDDSLSFYESGVGDVDAQMDPTAPTFPELDVIAVPESDIELPAESYSSESVAGLKEIIAELTGNVDMADGLAGLPNQDKGAPMVDAPESMPAEEAVSERSFVESAVRLASEDGEGGPESQGEGGEPANEEAEPPSYSGPSIQADAGYSDGKVSAAGESKEVFIPEAEITAEAPVGTESEVVVSETTDVPLSTGSRINIDLDALHTKAGIIESVKVADEVEDIDYMARTARRRRKRMRRRIIRWTTRTVSLVLLCIGVYVGLRFLLNRTETPGKAYGSALEALEEGKYAVASKEFLSFARRFPNDIMRSDAKFMGGYALQLTPSMPRENAERAYAEAIILLEEFVSENPSHAKVARAETLIGVLQYRMENYLEAISILGDPNRRLRDPRAYLITLRTLARSYAALSQTENAHSAFMRAASLRENMAPDEDYVELGSLYQSLSTDEAPEELKVKYLTAAVEQWEFALRVPGILKSRKEDITLLRDVVVERLESGDLNSPERAEPRPRTSLTTRRISRGNNQGESEGSSVAPQ